MRSSLCFVASLRVFFGHAIKRENVVSKHNVYKYESRNRLFSFKWSSAKQFLTPQETVEKAAMQPLAYDRDRPWAAHKIPCISRFPVSVFVWNADTLVVKKIYFLCT